MGKYFNTNASSQLQKPLLNMSFSFNFASSIKKNRIIGMNTNIAGSPKTKNIISVIQTKGANPLEKKIRLNDQRIFNEIESIRKELKEVFFEAMTEETKNKLMEAEYV